MLLKRIKKTAKNSNKITVLKDRAVLNYFHRLQKRDWGLNNKYEETSGVKRKQPFFT